MAWQKGERIKVLSKAEKRGWLRGDQANKSRNSLLWPIKLLLFMCLGLLLVWIYCKKVQ